MLHGQGYKRKLKIVAGALGVLFLLGMSQPWAPFIINSSGASWITVDFIVIYNQFQLAEIIN